MRVPLSFVREYLPEAHDMPIGDKHVIRVQLVYLPPFAYDVTPETPAVGGDELSQGVTVRKDKGRGDMVAYSLSGLPLTSSQAAIEGYWVRGMLAARVCFWPNLQTSFWLCTRTLFVSHLFQRAYLQ